jgi:hypothetical protein
LSEQDAHLPRTWRGSALKAASAELSNFVCKLSTQLRHSGGLHDRRSFLTVSEARSLSPVGVDPGEFFSVTVKDSYDPVPVLAPLVRSKVGDLPAFSRFCFLRFSHFPPRG